MRKHPLVTDLLCTLLSNQPPPTTYPAPSLSHSFTCMRLHSMDCHVCRRKRPDTSNSMWPRPLLKVAGRAAAEKQSDSLLDRATLVGPGDPVLTGSPQQSLMCKLQSRVNANAEPPSAPRAKPDLPEHKSPENTVEVWPCHLG